MCIRVSIECLLALVVLLSAVFVREGRAAHSLPMNYEADALPSSLWSLVDAAAVRALSFSGGILTVDKIWEGTPHVLYHVNDLTFNFAAGVNLQARLWVGGANGDTPIWLSVTDEDCYFAYYLIFADRIQRHRQDTLSPVQTHAADFTQWHTLSIEFESRNVRLYMGDLSVPVLEADVTGRYTEGMPRSVIFGNPGGVQGPHGPTMSRVTRDVQSPVDGARRSLFPDFVSCSSRAIVSKNHQAARFSANRRVLGSFWHVSRPSGWPDVLKSSPLLRYD